MLKILKSYFPQHHPLRLACHRFKAFLACLWYRYPSNKLIVIGITGTNGKTTTVNLTTRILEKAGFKVGMSSTINFKIDRKEWQNTTHKTTLGPFQMQKLLRDMVNTGCRYAVVETSSHAIAQHRVAGVNYDVAVISNVTPEHLDYHKSMKAYREEKIKLFASLSEHKKKKGVAKISIHNSDDQDNYEAFMGFPADQKIGYGRTFHEDPRIQDHVTAKNIELHSQFTDLTLQTPKEEKRMRYYLPGDFNIDNLLAAVSVATSQGVSLDIVAEALKGIHAMPGRLEAIEEGQPFKVFIDFALTENSFKKLLMTVRPLTTGKLWVVFGCCGDRDQKKRPKIGEICALLADRVIVCDDEPYTEDPKAIRDMILQGIHNTTVKENEQYFEISDREEAIRFAITHAQAGDSIVVPGMGDFEGRTFKDGVKPWSERQVIRKVLKESTPCELVSGGL